MHEKIENKVEKIKKLFEEAYKLYKDLFVSEKEEIHKYLNKLNENKQ